MAQNEIWLKSDVKKMISVEKMKGALFFSDENANLIGVEVFDNGTPKTLDGTVTASVIRQDGETITLAGSKQANRACVVLSDDCYEVTGLISVCIKIESGSAVATIAALETEVYRTEG